MPRITPVPVPTTITELADLSEQINQAISSETLPDGITLQGNSNITWIPPTTEEYNIGIDSLRFNNVSSSDYFIRNNQPFTSGYRVISNREAERELERRAELEREQRQIDEAQATWRNALNNIPSSRNREFTNPIIDAANEMAASRITVDEGTRLNIAGQPQTIVRGGETPTDATRRLNSEQGINLQEDPIIIQGGIGRVVTPKQPTQAPIEEFSYYKHFGALVAE